MNESARLEFKEKLTNTFLKTVSAFANYDGGQIVFGIDDAGNIKAVDDASRITLSVENKINDNISPMPDYSIKCGADGTVTLNVEPGMHKPYFYKSKAYKRNDTSTVEVDEHELARLILEGKHLTYDAIKTKDKNLKFDILGEYFKLKVGVKEFNKDTLKTLNLYSDENAYNNAAAVLSDKNGFPGIDIARFGESISIILKRETIKNVSAISAYEGAMGLFRDNYVYEMISGSERIRVEKIPEEAFREAVANALIHRFWDVDTQIKISMFDDRIEIVSPGGLPKGLSKEDYLNGHLSILRNPIIANVFFRLHMVEIFGTGILRIKELYEGCPRLPAFEISDTMIKVTLPVTDMEIELTDDEKIVYGRLSRNIPRSISEIVPGTGFGRSKVKELLKNMSKKGVVTTEGNRRGTKYRRRAD